MAAGCEVTAGGAGRHLDGIVADGEARLEPVRTTKATPGSDPASTSASVRPSYSASLKALSGAGLFSVSSLTCRRSAISTDIEPSSSVISVGQLGDGCPRRTRSVS